MAALLLAAVVSACGPSGEWQLAAAAPDAALRTVHVASTRGAAPETGRLDGRRLDGLSLRRMTVAIPPRREAGRVQRSARADPATDFTVTEAVATDPRGFEAGLRRILDERPGGERQVVIFVHGFNTDFTGGLFRAAQLGHDLDLPRAQVHYSWPSAANPLGYAYDRDSMLFARDGLEETLRLVARAGADEVFVLAHSMGALLAVETLRQIALRDHSDLDRLVDGVILVSPDIDVAVFRQQAQRIAPLPQPFVIAVSRNDRVLRLSGRVSGDGGRLGSIGSAENLSEFGVTVIDLSAFDDAGGGGHFVLGASPAFLRILSRNENLRGAFADPDAPSPGLVPGAVSTIRNATEIVLSPTGLLD